MPALLNMIIHRLPTPLRIFGMSHLLMADRLWPLMADLKFHSTTQSQIWIWGRSLSNTSSTYHFPLPPHPLAPIHSLPCRSLGTCSLLHRSPNQSFGLSSVKIPCLDPSQPSPLPTAGAHATIPLLASSVAISLRHPPCPAAPLGPPMFQPLAHRESESSLPSGFETPLHVPESQCLNRNWILGGPYEHIASPLNGQ